MKILARKLLNYDTDVLWRELKGKFTLIFDDGFELETNYKETIYSHYTWIFLRQYPEQPLLYEHHIKSVIGKKSLTSNTHIKLLTKAMWGTFIYYRDNNKFLNVDELSKLVYETSNKMYNELSVKLEKYVVSLDIVDFLEVMEIKEIQETFNNPEENQEYINKTYDVIDNVLSNNKLLTYNPIAKAVKAKLVKHSQVLQCIGPRGYLTDIDSNVFKQPIVRGYTLGIRRLYDSLIESRSVSKSLYLSKSDLQLAEYFSRKLQLLCQTVKNLHIGDCGSTNYLIWKVKPPTVENGVVIDDGDLKNLLGKYYLNEETGKINEITEKSTFLEGKYIKLRSVVAGCSHTDPYGVCSTCFGSISYSVPKGTNIGQLTATSLTKKTSQSILSVKHLDSSSVVEKIVLLPGIDKYLKVNSKGDAYLLSDNLKKNKAKIVISSKEALGITDIREVDEVESLAISRVTSIVSMTIIDELDNKIPVNIAIGKRLGSLTYTALNYIKKRGWEIDEKDNYVINMDGWNYSEELITVPAMHFNMSDVTKEITTMLESSVKELKRKAGPIIPEAALFNLYELVNKHLSVNLATLELIVLGAMVVSVYNRDFRIPKTYTTKAMGVSRMTIPGRSAGSSMAYEDHSKSLTDPASYFHTNRPSHPMDVFLCPREVMDNISN